MTGQWVFVCGPSGVGKDSVIAWAVKALAGQSAIVFARRLITRPAQPASDHDAIGEDDFLLLQQSGGLRWCWQAHGFYYGISQHYASHVSAGGIVVVNGSRSHVDGLPASPDVKRVEITASPEAIASRLAERGRDTQEEVLQRLARNASLKDADPQKVDLRINNDGEVAQAGWMLATYLAALAAQAGISVPLTRPRSA
jgi:phosphonate metabolism protein PhnN/1,5-bisphosphokinase (PRPP-forming)